MKQIIKTSIFLSLAILSHVTLAAYDFEVDGIYYNINGNEATVTYKSYNNYGYSNDYENAITIPSSVFFNGTTYAVTAIDDHTFCGCGGLTSISIPASVVSIGKDALLGCSGLTSITVARDNPNYDSRGDCNAIIVTASNALIAGCMNTVIPNSVTYISDGAFSYCYNLTNIDIPNSITYIGEKAFCGCGLTSVIIPNSVTYIGDEAFSSCMRLINIDLGNSVTYIGDEAFWCCYELANIDIPNSVSYIGRLAFFNCFSLASIEIGNSVTTIGEWAFACDETEKTRTIIPLNIIIPNSITNIGDYAFSGRGNLETIKLGNSLISISAGMFYGCRNLKSIEITNSVTNIGDGAFNGCTNLTDIDIPNSVTHIGFQAFSGCSSLATINIPNSVTSIGEQAFEYCSNMRSVTIGSSITHIGNGAFYYCGLDTVNYNAISCLSFDYTVFSCEFESRITTINIGDSVIIIPDYFAAGVQHLKEIIIPNSVTSIGMWAFNACDSLSNITLGSSIKTIGDLAFAGAKITSIIIPNTVTEIGDGAFLCPRLTSVTSLATTPPTCYSSTYSSSFASDVTSQATLYVPFKSLSAYQNANNWKDFYRIVGIQQIDDFEVNGVYYHPLTDKTVMVIPKTDEGSYYHGNAVIPDSVSYQEMQFAVIGIDANAFDGCDELNSVVIGDAVETIGEEAFQGCTGLTSVTFGSGVTSIGDRAFNYCNALQTVTCHGTVPPAMASSNCFSSAAYRKATLKVHRNYIETYTATDFWYKFEHIEGYGSLGNGDVNGDGIINIADVTVTIDQLLGGSAESEFYFESADLNYNGRLDIGDITTLIDLLLTH